MKPLVELNKVRFSYEGKVVLDSIDFHLHPGQFAALVGPSGAGKTTLIKLILQLIRPTGGQLYRRDAPPLSVAYVPQLETVDWNFPVTAEEVVLMGLTRKGGFWPWPRPEHPQRARQVMEQLGIAELAGRHIHDLSGGQQQRVFLARALIAEPELLVLDEPMSGVDMQNAENILHLLSQLNRQGMTILLSMHDLNMAAAHVPWIICLSRSVIAQGFPADVFTEAILTETYRAEMLVVHQNGMMFIHQKPHHHGVKAVVPAPVAGGLPGHEPKENGRYESVPGSF